MSTPDERARERKQTAQAARQVAADAWAQVDPDQIVASWTMQLPGLTVMMTGSQVLAATGADEYLDETGDELGLDTTSDLAVDPRAFGGTASDGRPLASLLASPAFTALQAIGSGLSVPRAVSLGGQHLDMIVNTQIADAGRVADGTALTARRNITGYVRQVVGATCARCTILAGRFYEWNSGFQRHPHCDCVHVPSNREQWRESGRFHDPRQVYDSLSVAQRQRAGWSLADQEAVADGADLTVVTNMKGVTTAGSRRSVGRLTPDQIYKSAAGNRDEAIRLLRFNGYLRAAPVVRATRGQLTLAAAKAAPTEADLSKLTVVKLREMAKQRGVKIPAGSRKADIVSLLAGPAVVADEFAGLTVAQLRALAKERGVTVLARDRKADLLTKLRGAPVPAVPAPVAPRVARSGRFSRTQMTRAELAKAEARAELSRFEVALRNLTEEERAALGLDFRMKIAKDRLAQKSGSTTHNWDSPWWSDVGAIKVRGVPSADVLRRHIEGLVNAGIPQPMRRNIVDALVRQAERVPRTVLDLLRIPGLDEFDLTKNADTWAYFKSRRIFFNPRVFLDESTRIFAKWRKALSGGWWSRTDAAIPVASTLAHEFGHHVAFRILGLADFRQTIRLAEAFDRGLGADGSILARVRRSADLGNVLDLWLKGINGAAARRAVSEYAGANHQELMAEVWHEFTTATNPRPYIQLMGRAMQDLAESLDIVRL